MDFVEAAGANVNKKLRNWKRLDSNVKHLKE